MSSVRLQKIIAEAGIASRRKAEELILAGKVMVNGRVRQELGTKADPQKDKILVNRKPIKQKKKMYIMLYKPRGFISSTVSREGQSVLELVHTGERLYPVGRLDKESEGLLILTNDGDYALKATHPRYEHEKEYMVELDKPLSPNDERRLGSGTMLLEGTRLAPIRISGRKPGSLVVKLVLKEGKKHHIRRVLDQLGYAVKRLVRIRIGNIRLGQMQPGQWQAFKP